MKELYLPNVEEISNNLKTFIDYDINKDSYCENKAKYIYEYICNFIDGKTDNLEGSVLTYMYVSFMNGYILQAIRDYDLYSLDCKTNNREMVDKTGYIETEIELRLLSLKKCFKI